MATAFWERGFEHIHYVVVMSFLALNASDDAARQYEALLEDGHRILAEMNRRRGEGADADEAMDLEEKAAAIAVRQVALRAVGRRPRWRWTSARRRPLPLPWTCPSTSGRRASSTCWPTPPTTP